MLPQARGMVVVSKQLKICYLVSEQLKNTSLFVSSKKTFSQLVGMVMSPADVKIICRVVFPNQTIPYTPKNSSTFPVLVCNIIKSV